RLFLDTQVFSNHDGQLVVTFQKYEFEMRRKPKRVKDSTYHKEKMLLCKQAEKGVQLQAEQSDWLADTDQSTSQEENQLIPHRS
ncbi:hypothetical protein Tco_0138737, partial [Tanacetum coccineum]